MTDLYTQLQSEALVCVSTAFGSRAYAAVEYGGDLADEAFVSLRHAIEALEAMAQRLRDEARD